MTNSTFDAGLLRSSASIAHAFLRNQVLAILAPVYLFQHRRAGAVAATRIDDLTKCGPNRAIDLQPSGIGRS